MNAPEKSHYLHNFGRMVRCGEKTNKAPVIRVSMGSYYGTALPSKMSLAPLYARFFCM